MGASIALPDSTVTKVLAHRRDCKLTWFQNFNTGTGVYIKPKQQFPGVVAPVFTTAEWYIQPAVDSTHPGYLMFDAVSGVTTWDFFAYQNSGGSVNLVCGQEYADQAALP